MYGPAKSESSKPRYSKLRASCDTCFLAKVKCSKARPICSRCLVCGADCKYSPSSRAGKPKSDGSHRRQSKDVSKQEESAIQYPTPSMSIDVEQANSYGMDQEWSSIMGSPDTSMHHRQSMSSSAVPVPGDEGGSDPESGANQDVFDPVFSWTNSPGTDMASPYLDSNTQHQHIYHQQSKSLVNPSTAQPLLVSWYDQPDYSTSASGPVTGHSMYISHNSALPRNPTCNCFNTCLSALQALHNSDALTPSSPFDIILTINQRAVETCSTMLNCPICTSKSGSSLRTMLLGTILGRIISIYQDASKNYFALTSSSSSSQNGGQQLPQPPLPLTFGTYRVANEDVRWLQMEIILRDLKKLQELFAKFQETSLMSESEEDAGMHGAVSNYLCRSLNVTFESLRKQRSFTGAQY
ncbi:hypothetical protein ONS95_007388 [Cadophora gregata]|uniref:uncharacterized protein n=1 Tax=Cadophora gregata TaxID=51156 RepID=UPI0026DCB4CD|nr:uncharacterized protein ONS95_007388 [Cadophora gregata]KAK0118497.1 hypothetical protein ONS96_011593 [Cadophora gregata f. sp. sojae]KAK0125755.1 hypothetical protein ONS95_007388 [Cadophora gregata]